MKVLPEGNGNFLDDNHSSHYYAARNTSAAAVEVSNSGKAEHEKYLFYRGVASFQPPLSVRLVGSEAILQNRTPDRPGAVILFENRGGRIGYRAAADSDSTLERPELNGDIGSLQREFLGALIAAGLFPDEAQAMLETWRDTWFEEGARVIYILPRAAVDAILPLTIDPSPAKIERVFVGRIEIVTTEMVDAVAAAQRSNDRVTLAKYGRFLEPILSRLR